MTDRTSSERRGVEPTGKCSQLETAQRDYVFRLAPADTDRCHDCAWLSSMCCNLLDLAVYNPRKSRCPLHLERA